ncbi:MAG: glycosyltransferase [Candidatus Omnitrophota bacterium]
MKKLVSVIIPTYNRARYLKEAIDSVLRQTFQGFEIIVVDDSSTDDTKDVVSSYGRKVKYILQENRERAAARNRGARDSEGDYVAFLDSDDLWLPNHLEECLKALRNVPDAGVFFSGSYIIDENGAIVSKMGLSPFNGYVLDEIISKYSSGGCNASSCLIKKTAFEKAGYFNEDRVLSGSEDWEMWARISAQEKFISTGVYTAMVRFHKGKSSIDADRMAKSMTMALDLLYKNPLISPRIERLRKQAYAGLFTTIGINYYAAGKMNAARGYLKKAVKSCPVSLFTNKYIIYTFLRSLLGHWLSLLLRRVKWTITGKLLR